MRTERLGDSRDAAVLILQPGDSLRCDEGEIPVVIQAGMQYTISVARDRATLGEWECTCPPGKIGTDPSCPWVRAMYGTRA